MGLRMNKILFVIVIYGISREESPAWRQLQTMPGAEPEDVYVHDNTSDNRYLAAAYNGAWQYAEQNGYAWMVLLDADTAVTPQYLEAVREAAGRNEGNRVFCPTLIDGRGRVLSPFRAYGIPTAFNSGLLIPVRLVREIGGFNEAYPLDYLDYWFCRRLHQLHIPLETLPVSLHHSLSVTDYKQVPRWRYLSLLSAEKRFAAETGRQGRYKLLLLCRLIKWTLTGHKYVKETYNALTDRQ